MKRLLAEIYMFTFIVFNIAVHFQPDDKIPKTPLDHVGIALAWILVSAAGALATIVLFDEYTKGKDKSKDG